MVHLKTEYDVQQAQCSIIELVEQQRTQYDAPSFHIGLEKQPPPTEDYQDYIQQPPHKKSRQNETTTTTTTDLFENLNRLTGVTGFRVQYPGTLEYMLGIRFDVPSSNSVYSVPHYVIIKQAPSSKGYINTKRMEVFQHTIPPFLPLERLARTFLNSNLKVFVRKLRACLVYYTTRRDIFEGKGRLLGVEVIDSNRAFSQIRLVLLRRNANQEEYEDEVEKEIVLECSEDTVVSAKLVDSGVQGKHDLPILETMKGPIIGLPVRLRSFFRQQ